MKNSTLLFRSLIVIFILAGTAHWATYAAKQLAVNPTSNAISDHSQPTKITNDQAYYLLGKWTALYDSKEFKGSIVYDIKNEGGLLNGYIHSLLDENGYSFEDDSVGKKILIVQSFDGEAGKGIYKVDYAGKQYDIECTIQMLDEKTFELTYDYYGYGDTETWKKQ